MDKSKIVYINEDAKDVSDIQNNALKEIDALSSRILRNRLISKLSSDQSTNTDAGCDNAMQDHEENAKDIFHGKIIKKLVVYLSFLGLLFSLIFLLVVYLFASNSTAFSSELPRLVSLVMVGILGIIAWVGYGWIGRNERSEKKEQ